jgi:fumarate hydratase class I
MNIVEKLAGLMRDTSSSLPPDVEAAIKKAFCGETRGSSASVVLGTILDNVRLARKLGSPLCQDTGTLAFYVDAALRRKVSPAVVKKAVALATARGYLRKNCIDSVTGKSYDDNCADGAPVIHYVDWQKPGCVTLVMKGGGSENMSRQYSLPDSALGAGRDLAGVRKCILDAVQKTQGYGCAPGILGVCIGGDRATAYEVAKEQLLRPLDASGESPDPALRKLERALLKDANSLGIGPMGRGGKTTLLGVRVAARTRVPASFFVTVAYMCWACRRGSLKFKV